MDVKPILSVTDYDLAIKKKKKKKKKRYIRVGYECMLYIFFMHMIP